MKNKPDDAFIELVKARFAKHMHRHEGIQWQVVQGRLHANAGKLAPLIEMEKTGGEPDVIAMDEKTGQCIFYDFSTESPKERRSLCYDREALASRKENKPKNSAIAMAAAMGIQVLTEAEYCALQTIEKVDLKTSSWVKTPEHIRKLGGAIFCDRRYDVVFTYHNGADSYYAARGFRGAYTI